MTDRKMIDIYQWLFNIEADLSSDYENKLNIFYNAKMRYLDDYLRLYESELKLKHFKQFSNDLIKLLEIF